MCEALRFVVLLVASAIMCSLKIDTARIHFGYLTKRKVWSGLPDKDIRASDGATALLAVREGPVKKRQR